MLVFPGQVIESEKKPGDGIYKSIAVKAGIVREKKTVQVVGSQKRYVPQLGDFVIGTVVGRNQEQFRVDIGSAFSATLDAMAFEGATKRNRPNINIGSILYCQVSLADKDLDPEVVCINGSGKAAGMGELIDGYVFKCSLGMASSLTNAKNPILTSVSEVVPFEMVVGLNGRVWVKTGNVKSLVLLINLFTSADGISADQLPSLISHYVQKLSQLS